MSDIVTLKDKVGQCPVMMLVTEVPESVSDGISSDIRCHGPLYSSV